YEPRYHKERVKSSMRATILTFTMTIFAAAQVPGRAPVPPLPIPLGPRASVRPPDSHQIRSAVTGLLGWRVTVPGDAFGQTSISEAAAKVDAAGAGFIEGSSNTLDYKMSLNELGELKHKLNMLRVAMPVYSVETMPADNGSRRKLFEFAKFLGIQTIIANADSGIEKLADEFGVNVAFPAADPQSA